MNLFRLIYFIFLICLSFSCAEQKEKKSNDHISASKDPYAITDLKSYRDNLILPDEEMEFESFSLTAGEILSPEDIDQDLEEMKALMFAGPTEAQDASFGLTESFNQQRYARYDPVGTAVLMDDAQGTVKAYSRAELNEREIVFDNTGKAYYSATKKQVPPTKNGQEIMYAMSPEGQFYIQETVGGVHHHTSFFDGGPVAAAGTLQFDKNSRLERIDNSTGHYQVPHQALNSVMAELSRRQVSIPKLKVGMLKKDRVTGERVNREKIFKVMRESHPEQASYFRDRPKNPALEDNLANSQVTKLSERSRIQQGLNQYNDDYEKASKIVDQTERIRKKDELTSKHNDSMNNAFEKYSRLAKDEKKHVTEHNKFYDSYHKKNKKKIRKKVKSETIQKDGSRVPTKPKSKSKK